VKGLVVSRRFIVGLLLLVLAAGVFLGGGLLYRSVSQAMIRQAEPVDRQARLRPDYSGSVIPPNIAPLSFVIQESGVAFCARISSQQGQAIEVFSRDGVIEIPLKRWRSLLAANRGQTLCVDVFARDKEGRWSRFQTITNQIAREDIDDHLVYRKMHLTHVRVRSRIGVYCRDLTGFKESVVLDSASYEGGCLNCHSFRQNHWDRMLLGVRSEKYGTATLLAEDGVVRKLGTKFGYPSWHPSGRLAVYAINNIPLFFHSTQDEVRDTTNVDSMLMVYDAQQHRIAVEPKLAQKDWLENWPTWSGDGKYLYFCTARKLWQAGAGTPPPQYDQIKYDLVRIPYEIETNTWGQIESVLSAGRTGKSIGMPRVSPDGRFLSFCMFDYDYFPAWKQESDLYMIDLEAPQQDGQFAYRRLDINSDQSEAWQTWSSNSRWLVFSSKRLQGVFTRLFISYVDAAGNAHKPILLPQKDPTFYDSCLLVFNTPELVVGPPQVAGESLARAFRSRRTASVAMPVTMATPAATRPPSAPASETQHE
jgi:Tol biopolymer transport system component